MAKRKIKEDDELKDIYDRKSRIELADDGTISLPEAAFMDGYDEAEILEED